MPESLGEQLKLQQSLNKLIKEQIGLMQQTSRLMGQQTDHAQKMCKAMDSAAPMAELKTQTQEATEGLKKAADQADRTSESMGGLRKTNKVTIKSFKDLLEYVEKNSVAFGVALGAARGFIGGLKMGYGMIKGFTKGISSLVGTFMKLGQTILSIPFKIMTGLIKMSQRGGIDPLRQSLEKLRGEFGSLATNEGKMFVDSVKQSRKEASNLAGTGLRLSRVFGYGREGLAKLLEYNAEVAKAMGMAFGNLRGEFAKNSVALAMYRKGLGMTAEQQAVMLKLAKARGQSMKESQLEFASMAIQMGEKFDINAKVVGKAMAEMQTDVSNFGHMSVKQLGATAVFAAKLGVEIKDLMGVFDKFDNFENAAKGAAELSQAFGMNVDVMAMLKAESPAQSVDILRKSFFDAGNTLETMNRHQRKLLEQSSGLKGVALEAAFANKNMGMSYKDIETGAAGAEKKQLTQAESMQKLSKSIEKLVKSGEHGFNSFFDAFSKGFSKGILRSKEFRKIMLNLRRSLRVVYLAGRTVGRMFVKMFPGIKDIAKGLGDLFDPDRFKILAKKLIGVFKGFFLDLKNKPKEAVQNLLDGLTKTFTSHFGASGGALGQMAKGFKLFIKAIGGIIAGLIPIIKKNLAEGLESLIDLIVNPPSAAMAGAAKGAQGFVMSIFGPIWEAIAGNPELNRRIWDSIETLFGMLWEKVKASTWARTAAKYFVMIVVGKILLASLINIFAGAILGKFVSVIGGGLSKMFGAGIDKATPAIMDKISAQSTQILELQSKLKAKGDSTSSGKKLIGFLVVLAAIVAAIGIVMIVYKKYDFKVEDAKGVGILVVAMAGSMALMTPALKKLEGMKFDAKVLKNMGFLAILIGVLGLVAVGLVAALGKVDPMPSARAVATWGAMMLGMMTMALPLIGTSWVISKMKSKMTQALVGMAILGVFMGALGLVGAIIAEMLSKIDNPEGTAALMEGISTMLNSVTIMLPFAALLGIAAMSYPLGTAGAAIAIVGFMVLGGLVTAMVYSLMPAVRDLAAIKIPNVESFNAVSSALVSIMSATNTFLSSLGDILSIMDPWPWETDTLEGNLKGLGAFVKIMMDSGINEAIKSMVELAKSSDANKDAAPLIEAIGGMLTGVAGLLVAFSPSDKMMEVVASAGDVEDSVKLMTSITDHMKAMMPIMLGDGGMLATAGDFIKQLAQDIQGQDFSKIGPLVSAIGPILASVAAMMKAMSPTEGEMAVMAKQEGFAETYVRNMFGESKAINMGQINRRMKAMIPGMQDLLKTIGAEIKELIDKLTPIIAKVGAMKIKPAALTAVTKIISSVIGGMSGLMSGIGPSVAAAAAISGDPKRNRGGFNFKQILGQIGDFAGTMVDSFEKSMPSIERMIKAVIKIARGIGNTKGLKKQVAVIGEVFNIIGIMQTAFSSSALEGGQGSAMAGVMALEGNMNLVSERLLKENGPLQKFIDKIGALKKPKGVSSWKYLKKKTKRLAGAFEGIGSMMTTLGTMSKAEINLDKLGTMGESGTGVLRALETTLISLDSVFARSPHLTNPKKAAAIAKSIQTLEGALSRPMAETVEAVTAFAGGKLEVTHNLPNTKIVVTVNLNAKELAKGISTVDISKDPGARGYLAHGVGADKSKVAP